MRSVVDEVWVLHIQYKDPENRDRDNDWFLCGPGALARAVEFIRQRLMVDTDTGIAMDDALPAGFRAVEEALYGECEEYPEFGVFLFERRVPYIG